MELNFTATSKPTRTRAGRKSGPASWLKFNPIIDQLEGVEALSFECIDPTPVEDEDVETAEARKDVRKTVAGIGKAANERGYGLNKVYEDGVMTLWLGTKRGRKNGSDSE